MAYINDSALRYPGENMCGRIMVKNVSGSTIALWSAAAICDSSGYLKPDRKQIDIYEVVPAVNDSLPWGIVLTELAPGECGSMQLSGVVPVWTEVRANGRITPSANGFTGSMRGRGEVLVSGDIPFRPAVILLNSPAGGEYNGGFKAVCTGNGSCRIINGYDPADRFCGKSDLPGAENIAAAEVPLTGTVALSIYLRAYKNDADEGTYRADIGTYDTTALFNRLIAVVRHNCYVDQVFEGSEVIFGRDYFL